MIIKKSELFTAYLSKFNMNYENNLKTLRKYVHKQIGFFLQKNNCKNVFCMLEITLMKTLYGADQKMCVLVFYDLATNDLVFKKNIIYFNTKFKSKVDFDKVVNDCALNKTIFF